MMLLYDLLLLHLCKQMEILNVLEFYVSFHSSLAPVTFVTSLDGALIFSVNFVSSEIQKKIKEMSR